MSMGIIIGFFIVCLAIVFIALVFLTNKKINKYGSEERTKQLKKKSYVYLLCVAVMIVMFLCVPFSFQTVEAGEVAVVKQLGKIVDVRTSGTYFDFWLIRTYDVYDAKVQEINISTQAYTSDSQPMQIELTVQFQIQADNVKEIASNYGKLQLLSSRIQNVSVERTKAILSGYKAETLIAERASVSPAVEQAIREALSDKYYVTFNAAVLTDISFSDAFEAAVEAKMTAEQNKLQAEYENEKKVAAAKAELEVTKTLAEAKLAAAEGDAKAQLAISEAEAKSIALKSLEIARMMGFEIKQNNGSDGATTYYIDFEGKSIEEIEQISAYLKWLEYLAVWDGNLPNVLVTDGNASIMITP